MPRPQCIESLVLLRREFGPAHRRDPDLFGKYVVGQHGADGGLGTIETEYNVAGPDFAVELRIGKLRGSFDQTLRQPQVMGQ